MTTEEENKELREALKKALGALCWVSSTSYERECLKEDYDYLRTVCKKYNIDW